MSWEISDEDGVTFYLHEEYGNILRIDENTYMAFMPKVIKLGPFNSLDDAKRILTTKREDLDVVIENFATTVK
jgi:hypothetical protein